MTISDAAVRAAFDALPGQAAVLDRTGRILTTNRAWREFATMNGEFADHVGENYLIICDESHDEKATRTAAAIRSLVDGEREAVSIEYPCHGPERDRWFTMRGIRFDHGAETFVLVMHVDITERKLAELEVREQNDRLETVASVLSHDLRNPLNVALGRAELVESDHTDAVVRSLERMETIVEDALMLAAQERVTDTQPVELSESAERAWRQVETGDADLSVAESVSFEADPDLLGHVFENLVRNSVEHGATTVTVGACDGVSASDASGGSTAESVGGFFVEDDGPGIPLDDRESVFDVTYSTAEGGTGLGLAIVEQVVETHGWSIRATESVGSGPVGDSRTIHSDGGSPETVSVSSRGARFEVSF